MKQTGKPVIEDIITFSDELRREARGNSNTKMAFNDYFIRTITRRDGGLSLAANLIIPFREALLTGGITCMVLSMYADYYYYSPYYSNYWETQGL
jgi:hypothetical protein